MKHHTWIVLIVLSIYSIVVGLALWGGSRATKGCTVTPAWAEYTALHHCTKGNGKIWHCSEPTPEWWIEVD